MRKTFHISASLCIPVLMTLCVVGCNDDRLFSDLNSDSSTIRFNVSVGSGGWERTRSCGSEHDLQSPVRLSGEGRGDSLFLHPVVSDYKNENVTLNTRGNIVSSSDDMFDNFYVSAYHYTDSWDDDHLKEDPNYFVAQNTRKSGNVYTLSPQRYWPSEGKMRFLAHAPVSDASFTFYPHDDADRGPRVHISVNEDAKSQQDLLVSYSEEVACDGSNGSAGLNFKHALTGIRFVCDKTMAKGIITNITIKGVRYEGDFFYYMQDASKSSSSDLDINGNFNAWELYDRTFSAALNHKVIGEDSEQVTDGENTFVMFPQTLPESASIEITLESVDADGNPTGETDIITGSLAGREWPAGRIVTYKLSTSEQVLEVEEPKIFNYLGHIFDNDADSVMTYNPVPVTSGKGNKNMKWKVEYMDSGTNVWSETSSWLSIDKTWNWADTLTQEVRFVATSSYNSINIDETLKNAAQKGTSASPYNLSSSDGGSVVENTANCYMVDAPGYYILPLVYGNAIKDSGTYAGAYVYTASSGEYVLSNFVNHLGSAISAPYIPDNAGCVPASASIVWQDVQNLVQDVKYVPGAFGGKGGISFYISQANIAQGNCVLAISDKDNVMWSWHIWVTSFSGFDDSVSLVNSDNTSFTVMPVNLGWCSNGKDVRYYPKRQCKVRFTPTEGDVTLSQEVTFIQESHTAIPLGNNPYYQWGRKDPFVGTNIAWGNKERWDGTGKYYGTGSENNPPRLFSDVVENTDTKRLATIDCLDLLIKNPDKWHNPPAVDNGGKDSQGNPTYNDVNKIYSNLWGDNTLGYVKTVYDPCPPGYQVNYYYTYTGFLDPGYVWGSEKGVEYVKETPSDWDMTNLAEFYTDSSKLHSITFPVNGYRDWNAKAEVDDFGKYGFVWLRGCVNEHNAYMFRFATHVKGSGTADVAPCTEFYATDGMPVRPGASD